jgi:hypothetical protein
MNLNILPINVMLAHSGYWLDDEVLRAQLAAHPIGAALLLEIARIHARLQGQAERRRQIALALARFSEIMQSLDLTHDNMARAIHAVLEALLMATRDAAARELYLRLRDLLFPEGLSIVSRTYAYQAGAAQALSARVSEADLADLAAIPVGAETLADWYRAWITAGKQLGEHLHQRETLLARTTRGGTATAEVDTRAARLEWIEIVQTLLGAIDIMKLAPEVREQLHGPLEASITQALRTRSAGDDAPGDDAPGDDPGDGAPGDDAGDGTPGDDAPASVAPAPGATPAAALAPAPGAGAQVSDHVAPAPASDPAPRSA